MNTIKIQRKNEPEYLQKGYNVLINLIRDILTKKY